MIIYPSDGELAYNPFVGDIYKGIKNIERDEKNGSKHGYGYWLDNCGDGKWYCDHCEYFKDVFGNFVQCVKTGRFVDYEYWNNIEVEDCPLKDETSKEERKYD